MILWGKEQCMAMACGREHCFTSEEIVHGERGVKHLCDNFRRGDCVTHTPSRFLFVNLLNSFATSCNFCSYFLSRLFSILNFFPQSAHFFLWITVSLYVAVIWECFRHITSPGATLQVTHMNVLLQLYTNKRAVGPDVTRVAPASVSW